jgi:hypothetical protein
VTIAEEFLAAYDRQLRTAAETQGAIAVTHLGPLLLVTFAGGQGFVTYPYLDGTDAQPVAPVVTQALDHFRDEPEITRVEWKTRAHDRAPGLHEALLQNGFQPQEPESIMIGRAALLNVEVPLPDGVTLRQVREENDVRAMAAMQDMIFDGTGADGLARTLLGRLALGDGMELWVAEADGQIVGAGRLEPVAGTEFAGIWGGATLEAGAAKGSTEHSPRCAPGQPWRRERRSSTATPPHTRSPSWSDPASSKFPPPPRTTGAGEDA